MQQIILKYDITCDHYHQEKIVNGGIIHLTTFLTDDVGCHAIKFYREWLNNPERVEGGGNYSHLEKQGNRVLISFEYDWFHETPGAEVLEISANHLNYILDRWQEACEKKPNKIIITRDNDKISVDFED